MENKNIIIARQLVKIAKELVASRERKAFWPNPQSYCAEPFGLDIVITGDFDKYNELFKDVENTLCNNTYSNNEEEAKRMFNAYGGEYVVFLRKGTGKPVAVFHEGSHQLKDLNAMPVKDEKVLKAAARYLFLQNGFDFEKFKAKCVEDFKGLEQYIDPEKDIPALVDPNGGQEGDLQ